jgi:septal ring factor EnvC (AmiA/AmiB activator)
MEQSMTQRMAGSLLVLTLFLIAGCGQELQKENEALKVQIKTSQEENASLKEKLQSLETENDTLSTTIEGLEQQVAELEKSLEAAQKAAPARKAPATKPK